MRRLRYDPALDGVRALAVVGVMLYHAGVSWTPGGFLGVDVFFVLSGYLITTLLLDEQRNTGRIALGSFWMRRARRLVPALVVVLGWVVVYARWVDPEVQTSGVRGDLLATIFYVANWHDIFSNESYFALFSSPSPLIHTWSLAIEEQWYLLWPLAMLAWARWGRNRMLLGAGVIAGGALSSAVAMAMLADPVDPSRAYYGTDTRAQGLLIGALVAFLLSGRIPTTGRSRVPVPVRAAGWVSLGTVACFVLFVSDDMIWMYRGGFTLMAIATAGVIAVVRLYPSGGLRALLSVAPLPRIGRISYGLYLWHWPVYVLLTPARTELDGTALLTLRLSATAAVAGASFVLVERPVPRQSPSPSMTAALAAGLVALGSAVLVAVASPADVPASARLEARATNQADEAPDADLTSGLTPPQLVERPPPVPTRPTRVEPTPTDAHATPTATGEPQLPSPSDLVPYDEPVRAMVVGDSVYVDLLLGYEPSTGGDEIVVTGFGLLGCGTIRDDTRADLCAGKLDSWRATVEADRPDLAVLALSKWDAFDVIEGDRRVTYGSEEYRDLLIASWKEEVALLSSTGARVVILGLHCMQGDDSISGDAASIRTDPERTAVVNRLARQFVEDNAVRGNLVWLDIREQTCPDGVYRSELDGVQLHRDGIHYTPEGVDLVWEWLVPQLIRIGREGR